MRQKIILAVILAAMLTGCGNSDSSNTDPLSGYEKSYNTNYVSEVDEAAHTLDSCEITVKDETFTIGKSTGADLKKIFKYNENDSDKIEANKSPTFFLNVDPEIFNFKAYARLENNTDSEISRDDAIVTTFMIGKENVEEYLDIKLPGDITWESTYEDVINAFGKPSREEEISTQKKACSYVITQDNNKKYDVSFEFILNKSDSTDESSVSDSSNKYTLSSVVLELNDIKEPITE